MAFLGFVSREVLAHGHHAESAKAGGVGGFMDRWIDLLGASARPPAVG